jgi:hypothetical protein
MTRAFIIAAAAALWSAGASAQAILIEPVPSNVAPAPVIGQPMVEPAAIARQRTYVVRGPTMVVPSAYVAGDYGFAAPYPPPVTIVESGW